MESGFLRIPNPLIIKGNLAHNWKKFYKEFNIWMQATCNDEKETQRKVSILLNLIGEDGREIFDTLDLDEEEQANFNDVVAAFEAHFIPKTNIIFERHCFYMRSQQEGESFDSFLTDVKKLSKSCEFGTQEEALTRDRLIFGIIDRSLQEQLIKAGDPSLQKTIDACRTFERTKAQTHQIQSSTLEVSYVQGNFKKTNYNNYNKKQNDHIHTPAQGSSQSQATNNSPNKCRKCNERHTRGRCPAFGHRCNKCKYLHHFTKCCRSKNVTTIEVDNIAGDCEDLCVDTVLTSKEENYYIDTVEICSVFDKVKPNSWYENICIGNRKVAFKVDTGSDVNILPIKFFQNSNLNKNLENTKVVLTAYGGHKLFPIGILNLKIKFNEVECTERFIVVDTDSTPILGLNTCSKLGIISRVFAVSNTKEEFINSNKELFEGLGKFPDKLNLILKDNAEPVARPPRRLAIAIKDKVKAALDHLTQMGVIEPFHQATDWISNLVIVEKPNGSIRLCLDPKFLNNALKKRHYLIPTLDDLTIKLTDVKLYSVFDLKDGFYQVELTEDSSELCAFSTPFGVYKFKRLPFGIDIAAEYFQEANEKNFGDLPGVYIYIDDILVTGKTEAEHDANLLRLVSRAKQLNVKFNVQKLQYKVQEVSFLGHIFNDQGVNVDPKRIKAIVNMEHPTSKKELQRFLGMINYLRSFIPNMAELTEPLRQLLKNKVDFLWTNNHEKTVETLKQMLTKSPILQPFDINKKVVIQTDASKNGVGCVLLQHKKPVAYASRSLNDAETNYAQIEKELLAILYSCLKFHHYIYGRIVEIHTDHKPLVSIMVNEMNKVNSSRLQRMKLKLLKYNLEVKYVPGKEMHIADHLSRSYLKDEPAEEFQEYAEVVHTVNLSDEKKLKFQTETKNDIILKQIIEVYMKGWPNVKKNLDDSVKSYWKFRHDIYFEDGLLFLGQRIIVPESLRAEMLHKLHESHIGMTKTKLRARQILYWPGIDTDIENFISKCRTCEKYLPSNCKEPLIPHTPPDVPFEKVGCDILQVGAIDYLVLTDYFSKWIEILPLENKQSHEIILKLKTIFATHGIPKVLISDNMPFSSLECSKFSKNWNFEIRTSSPNYPRSNGQAEKSVHIAKNIIRKAIEDNREIDYALLEYRNHPVAQLNASPAQLLMSRVTRTKVPIKESILVPKLELNVNEKLVCNQNKTKNYHDKRTKFRPEFNEGENIVHQRKGKWEPAKIIEKHTAAPRSYIIKDENNRLLRRNKTHLRHSMRAPQNKYQFDDDDNDYEDRLRSDMSDNLDRSVASNYTDQNANNSVRPSNSTSNNTSQNLERNYVTRYGRIIRPPEKLKDYVR